MAVKQFFKSNAFKCLAALLCILLVCGVFLTVAYGFLEVSADEKLQRALNKIYTGQTVKEDSITDLLGNEKPDYGKAVIQSAYTLTLVDGDGNEITHLLVQSKGKNGYAGGTVTCWVAMIIDENGISGLYKVTVAANTSQTLMSKFTDSFFENLVQSYNDSIEYATADGYLVTGATKSSTAICNSLNGAISYAKAYVSGGNAQ